MTAMTEADLTLIKQFSATNQNEYQVTSGQKYMSPETWRMVLSILLSLFGIIITMMVGPILPLSCREPYKGISS